MKLSQLLKTIKQEIKIEKDFEITGFSIDSKTVKEGNIFAAVKGHRQDGFLFVPEAVKRGAKVIIYDGLRNLEGANKVIVLKVPSVPKAISLISSLIYEIPDTLDIIGITGTNGKTTTTYLLEHIFQSSGVNVGVIGTVNHRYKNEIVESVNTTPEAVSLCKILYKMAAAKTKFVFLEVSSHALEQFRVDGIKFKHAIFTNLTQDHLDFHHSMEEYFLAKAKLFTDLKPRGYSVINIDNSWGRRLAGMLRSKVITYGFNEEAFIRAENVNLKSDGMSFDLWLGADKISIKSKLMGNFNVYNTLCACGIAFLEGVDFKVLKQSVLSFEGVPGRLERLDCGQPFFVFVDYAHTPQALENVLRSLKEFVKKRIITVFGCGGNRDALKRPLMGNIAETFSDIIILTDDNPRDENSSSIIEQIQSGIKTKSKVQVEPDRKKAIEKALSLAQAGDCVLLAGKGHENYQIIKDEKIEFNDKKIAQDFLRAVKC